MKDETDIPPDNLNHDGYQLWDVAGRAVKHGGHLGILALNIRAQLRLESEVKTRIDTIRWLRDAGRKCLVAMTNDYYSRPRIGMESEYEEMRLAIENADEILAEN